MKIKELLFEFLLIFVIVFLVSAVVTFLYTLFVHGNPVADWQTAFQMAIIFAIVIPWMNHRKKPE